MPLEIEHKYIVKDNSYTQMAVSCLHIRQGYLSRDKNHTIRVRTKGDKAYITIKTQNIGATRHEFEYEIPTTDAGELLAICRGPIIDKYRYIVNYHGKTWEVDEFCGDLSGIVVAEIELSSPDEPYDVPDFIGENVTGRSEYYNSNIHMLAKKR